MTDKTDLIVELIKGLKDDQKDHRDEMRIHQRESKDQHDVTNTRLTAIEIDLREHKEGVMIERAKNKRQDDKLRSHEVRITKVEEPSKVRGFLRNKILQAGGVAAAVLGIIKLLDYLGK